MADIIWQIQDKFQINAEEDGYIHFSVFHGDDYIKDETCYIVEPLTNEMARISTRVEPDWHVFNMRGEPNVFDSLFEQLPMESRVMVEGHRSVKVPVIDSQGRQRGLEVHHYVFIEVLRVAS